MTAYSFDLYGWLSADLIEGRSTPLVPPNDPLPEGMAWNFTGHQWIAMQRNPASAGPAPEAPAVPSSPRLISVGSFFDRFGPAKWAILADASRTVQALVKDCSVRKFIDLDRADLPAALGLLVQAGHSIDVEAILAAPVQPGELP